MLCVVVFVVVFLQITPKKKTTTHRANKRNKMDLQEGLTRETLTKMTVWHDFSTYRYVLLMWLFHRLVSRELLMKSTNSSPT